ncbi:MAG: hypothetical protein JRH20_30920 [Deltaproteobacteria bacterium]|nr:hypothetical protein [Deltaproteobacteria bacterium]
MSSIVQGTAVTRGVSKCKVSECSVMSIMARVKAKAYASIPQKNEHEQREAEVP